MVVRAFNRRTPSEPYEVASSTATTDSFGNYVIYVPLGRSGMFDLLVSPGPGQYRASLQRTGVTVTATSALTGTVELIRYPALPGTAAYQIPVEGPTASGGTKKVIGARVILSSTLASGRDTVTYQTEAVVGGTAGLAEVQLIPGVQDGNRTYTAVALPPPNAEQGALWDGKLVVGPGTGGVLSMLSLSPRVQVTGKVLDAMGRPAAGIAVKPVLSAAFMAAAIPETLALAERLPLPEVTTSAAGTFSMYLDAAVGAQAATYDLGLVPPNGSALPRWSRDEVSVAGGATVDVPEVTLPNGTLVSGTVRTEDGLSAVPDAVVQVYELADGGARPRAIAVSDAQGKISLVLPAP
jgi:hypothetical protein